MRTLVGRYLSCVQLFQLVKQCALLCIAPKAQVSYGALLLQAMEGQNPLTIRAMTPADLADFAVTDADLAGQLPSLLCAAL